MTSRRLNFGIGFTLIELLVAMGVIATLLAILLPALATVRESGRGIRCASNMHQIAEAVYAYVQQSSGLLPNNCYTLGDDPSTLQPPPPTGSAGWTTANYRGEFSTSNLEWFDVVAVFCGWSGRSTVASRYGAGQQDEFRTSTQYLWCPDVDQTRRDPGVFATNYGISVLVSRAFERQILPLPPSVDAYCFDFLQYLRVPHDSEVVFLNECGFWNYDSEPYNTTNASMANLIKFNSVKTNALSHHQGLNYLFFDGHVSRERKPPHSMGGELGTFLTADGDQYTVSSADDLAFRTRLVSP